MVNLRPAVAAGGERFRWGLVPAWSTEAKLGQLINARAETVTQMPSFRPAAAKCRCVLPADGYYEWQATPDGKQPYFLHHESISW